MSPRTGRRWGVLFDYDGTLADTAGRTREYEIQALQAHFGPALTEDMLRHCDFAEYTRLFNSLERLLGRRLPKDERGVLYNNMCNAALACAQAAHLPLPGALEMLKVLRERGAEMLVVTNALMAKMVQACWHVGGDGTSFADFFDPATDILCADQLYRGKNRDRNIPKPHPKSVHAGTRLMRDRYGLEKDDLLLVGDSYSDAGGCVALGLQFVLHAGASHYPAGEREAKVASLRARTAERASRVEGSRAEGAWRAANFPVITHCDHLVPLLDLADRKGWDQACALWKAQVEPCLMGATEDPAAAKREIGALTVHAEYDGSRGTGFSLFPLLEEEPRRPLSSAHRRSGGAPLISLTN